MNPSGSEAAREQHGSGVNRVSWAQIPGIQGGGQGSAPSGRGISPDGGHTVPRAG